MNTVKIYQCDVQYYRSLINTGKGTETWLLFTGRWWAMKKESGLGWPGTSTVLGTDMVIMKAD